MSISVTIPQLFYDLIARVIPGFLFLVVLGFEFLGTEANSIPEKILSSNSIVAILLAMACVVLFYLMGWVLHAFTFLSTVGKVKAKYEPKAKDAASVSEMYNRIRIKNEVVGFRITKLRAEARMLEASRVGMVIIIVIALSLLLLNVLGIPAIIMQSGLEWGFKLSVPLILGIAFWTSERSAWEKYYSNVVNHYKILCEEVQPDHKVRPPRKERSNGPSR